jgi:hypothetical protein
MYVGAADNLLPQHNELIDSSNALVAIDTVQFLEPRAGILLPLISGIREFQLIMVMEMDFYN